MTSLTEAVAIDEQIVDKELKSQSNCNEIQDSWYIIKYNFLSFYLIKLWTIQFICN